MKSILFKALRNELDTFINDEFVYDSVKANENGAKDYLESLTEDDKNAITERLINNDCLWEFINEEICYTLYHYKNWGGSKDEN